MYRNDAVVVFDLENSFKIWIKILKKGIFNKIPFSHKSVPWKLLEKGLLHIYQQISSFIGTQTNQIFLSY